MEDKNIQKENNKLWVDKEGIIRIFESKPFSEEEIKDIIKEVKRILKDFNGKARVLIRVTGKIEFPLINSKVRKEIAKQAKEIDKDTGLEKVAIVGSNIISRTIASFVISSSGLNNIKVFATENEALKWLRIKS